MLILPFTGDLQRFRDQINVDPNRWNITNTTNQFYLVTMLSLHCGELLQLNNKLSHILLPIVKFHSSRNRLIGQPNEKATLNINIPNWGELQF